MRIKDETEAILCRLCEESLERGLGERADVQLAAEEVDVDGERWPACPQCADLIGENRRMIGGTR